MKHIVVLCLVGSLSLLTGCGDKTLALGKEVYEGTCIACHAQGLNGAPMFGNKKMWAKRIGQGIPTLVEHASQGYGLMPAKGGNMDLTDEEIEAAIRYMLAQVE
jgi:cytochrome c5